MNLSTKKLFIFDLDGTILYTLEDLTDSVNFALKKMEFAARTVEDVRSFVGNGVGRLVRLSLPEDAGEKTYDECLSVFKRHYAEHCCDKTRAYDGIDMVFNTLKAEGKAIAIVSNKFHSAAVDVCEHYFKGKYDIVIGEGYDDGVHPAVRRKPSSDGIDMILSEIGVAKDEAVLIGDGETDFATANNAGIDFIGAGWGYRGADFLRKEGIKDIAEKVTDLIYKSHSHLHATTSL